MNNSRKNPPRPGRTGRYRAAAVFSALAFLIPVAAACSSTSGTDSAKKLVWVTNAAPVSLDINTVDNTTASALLQGNVIEALTRISYNANKELDWVPDLATSWNQIEPTVWRFKIRENVKFQNGQDLTAADVAYSVNRQLRPENPQSGRWQFIKSAKEVDTHTVDILTTQPYAYVDRMVYSIGITPKGWGDDNPSEAKNTAIGTGPFELASFTQGGNNAVLKRWSDYWGPQPAIDEVEMRVIPEAGSALSALQAGEADVVQSLPPELLQSAPKVLQASGILVTLGRIAAEQPPLNDPRVRRAINMAIDRESLVNNVEDGYAELPHGQIVPATAAGFNPSIEDYPYDPTAARKLVEEAGADGAKVTISCVSDSYDNAYRDTCQVLAQSLQAIGLSPELSSQPKALWSAGLYAPSEGGVVPGIHVQQTGTYMLESSQTLATWLTCESTRNAFCDKRINDEILNASSDTDIGRRTHALQEVAKEVHEAAPLVPLFAQKTAFAVAENVDGPVFPYSGDTYWADWTIK
jgi:peptide/nickel transport system substrate-binding protein